MITKMTRSNMKDFNKPNEGFIVSGRISPTYEDNVWKKKYFLNPILRNMKMKKLI